MFTRARIRYARSCVSALCCSMLLGCLDNDLPPDDGITSTTAFIAQQRDFADFLDWMDFTLEEDGEHAGATGKKVVYINRLPSSDDEAFPVGTMIVKTVESGKQSTWTVHAMAKRGSGFNARGALGWEFFELVINDDGVPIVRWRGEKPPNGETYQRLPGDTDTTIEAECSGCHKSSLNDAVLDDMLDLKALR